MLSKTPCNSGPTEVPVLKAGEKTVLIGGQQFLTQGIAPDYRHAYNWVTRVAFTWQGPSITV